MGDWSLTMLDPSDMNDMTRNGASVFRIAYGDLIIGDVAVYYRSPVMRKMGEEAYPFVFDDRIGGLPEGQVCNTVHKLWMMARLKARSQPPHDFVTYASAQLEDALLMGSDGPIGVLKKHARRATGDEGEV